MATPANLTYADIETRVCNQLRIVTTNTAEVAKIKAVINEVYRDFWAAQDWWFLVKRGVINTVAKYETGTASVTNNSTGVTLSDAPAVGLGSFSGRVFMVIGDTVDNNAVYRISSHTAGTTALTLDGAFTGATSTTASFKIYRDSYDAPADLGKLLKPRRYGLTRPMAPVGMNDMSDIKSQDATEGKPQLYTVLDFATSGDPTTRRQLVVHPYPDQTYRVEFTYKQQLNTELSGTTQPLIPDEYRQILVYGALARGYPIFLADTDRGTYFQNLFNDLMKLVMGAHREYNQDRPQFAPADNDRGRRATRHRGRVSLGSYFDRYPIDRG